MALTQKQLEAMINRNVAATLRPAREEFANRRRRAVALANALAELDKGVGQATNQTYQAGAQTLGALAGGFTGEMRQKAEADAAASMAALQRIGAPQEQINAVGQVGAGAPNAAYALGGAIPGGALAREGAAFSAAQNQLPATARGRGQYEVYGLDREEAELDATIPKLRQDISNQLIGQELSKAELALRQRAQAAYEANLGEDIRHNKANESVARQRARISNNQYNLAVRRHELAVRNAADEGRNVNAAISKRKGFLVDQRGRPIKDANGRNIPIPKDKQGGAAGKSGLTPYQQSQRRAAGVKEARELRGEPLENPNAGLPGEGKFIGKNGKSTNNPREAQRDTEYEFEDVVNQLATQYGVPRKVAEAWAVAAGWKRPPRKKKNKPQPKSGR